jgi:hypothetical protein
MTLVYTSNDGAAQTQLELSTPSQNVARPTLQDIATILTYPAPGGGLLRVPVAGGAPAPLNGTATGQIVSWDAIAGQWVVTDRPTLVRSIGNTLAADLDLVLLAAGHTPGYYLLASYMVTRVVATAGTLNRLFACNAPGGVPGTTAISTSGPQPTTLGWSVATGSQWYPGAQVISDGSAPIIARYTRVGITGAPVVDFYGQAILTSVL